MINKTTKTHAQKPCVLQHGFTMIEIMIVVIIVGLLSAVAYSSYSSNLISSRRSAAQGHLMDIAQREQQYFSDARSYAPDLTTLNITTPSDVAKYYTITICQLATGGCTPPGGTPPAFAAIATPIAGTSQANDGTLSVNSAGLKATTSSAYTW